MSASAEFESGVIVAVDEGGRTEVRLSTHPAPIIVEPGELLRFSFGVVTGWSKGCPTEALAALARKGNGE